jgi:branched-chain amino acid transport system ATP-binding protein
MTVSDRIILHGCALKRTDHGDLEIQDLASGYGDVQILWGATLTLEKGRLTSLVGTNGAGKTTLLRTVMGLIKPKGGAVRFDGQDISRLAAHTKAEMGLILVPEGRQLFTDMTVEENLEMGAAPQRAKPRYHLNLERVYGMFPRLQERRTQKAGTLSGGEQQMLAVARGLMGEPVVLMIDEMSLGLAPVLALELFHTLQRLREEGLTVLLVEQNVQLALTVSDYGYVLAQGRVDLHGPSRELVHNDHVRSAYLGL